MSGFLRDDYKEPVTANYMKFALGENTFRVLSSAIDGLEYWKTATNEEGKEVRKPVRLRPEETYTIDELEIGKDGFPVQPKVFWAFVVYNRDAEKVQILEVTQKTIRDGLKALDKSKAWGDMKEYDIVVTKTGEGMETEYSVMPAPKEKIDEGIVRLYKDMKINLDALYDGDDPFTSSDTKTAHSIADEADVDISQK
jgi:hypothetical protein